MVYKDRQAPANFYTTAVSTIAKSASWTTVSGIIDVFRAKTAYLQVSFYGTDASHTSGTVTFNFVARGDYKNNWPTTASFVVEATPNGTAQVIQDEIVDCEPYYDLKVLSIANGSATYAVNTLQANISYKF